MAQQRTRYGVVGTGSRAQMYVDAICGPHADIAELVFVCDANPGRAAFYARYVEERTGVAPAIAEPAALDAAVAAHRIDRLLVVTMDRTHADYVARGLRAGVDVVVEKPLTTSEDGVRTIADAVDETGRDVVITFNYRYSPRNAALKEVVSSGEIGDPLSVHFEWVLDTAHGADYFRRWHRQKDNSGGLLIHKASHHFDLVNWWISSYPTRVFASAHLRFYGAAAAASRGMGPRPERGTTDSPLRDGFSLDLRQVPMYQALYLDQEQYDGYLRDRDVFDPGITIEDNHSLVVDYANGATMSYSLNAHSPWEGYTVSVNGTEGRAELTVVERGEVLLDENRQVLVDPSAHPEYVHFGATRPVSEKLVVQRHFAAARDVAIVAGEGGHGGGDRLLLHDVFVGTADDPLGRRSTWQDGVRSVAVGLAGNRSIATGEVVRIADLDLGRAARLLAP